MNEQRIKRYAVGIILMVIMLLGRKTDLWAAEQDLPAGAYTADQIKAELAKAGGSALRIRGDVTLSGGTLDGTGMVRTGPVFKLMDDAHVTVKDITIQNFNSIVFYTNGTSAGKKISLHIGSEGTETKLQKNTNTNDVNNQYRCTGCAVVADISYGQSGIVDITMDHAWIEGNKVESGNKDGNNFYGYGAGLYVASLASLSEAEKTDPNLPAGVLVNITDSTFTANEASCGGAIDIRRVDSKSQIRIVDSTFAGNKASEKAGTNVNGILNTVHAYGGAIENKNGGGQIKTVDADDTILTRPNVLEIEGTTFEGNTADEGIGGGVYSSQADTVVTDCTFQDNTAYRAGGMYAFKQSVGDLKLKGDNIFTGNKSTSKDMATLSENVGGLRVDGMLETEGTVTFQNNQAAAGAGGLSLGGSMAALGGTVTLIENKGVYGGGLYYAAYELSLPGTLIVKDNTATERGGGIYQAADKDVTLQNVAVAGNKAANGGGIYMEGSTKLTLDSCTVKGNMASENGGGVYKSSGKLYLRGNTEISYNACGGTAGGGLYAGADSSNTVNAVQGTVKIADNYMNVSAVNNGSTTPAFTYSAGNAASNRSNAYLVYNSDKQYAAFTVDGALSAGAAFGVTSSAPVDGRIVVKPDGDSHTSLTAADLSYFTHDGKENGTSALKVDLDAAAKNIILAEDPVYNILSLDGVYPLLYSGESNQDLDFTLKDKKGNSAPDSILKQVTFTVERTDGFDDEELADYDVVTLNQKTVTAKKSGVVKIHAKYKDVVSSDFAVAVVPGDLDKNGSIQLNDAVLEATILRGAKTEDDFGTYGRYLANMNTIPGVDVDDIVKIVSMVRNISDYYN